MRFGSKVFVATDLSDSADEAIRQGHAWASASNGELAVCHVVPSVLGKNMLFPQFNLPETNEILDVEKRAAEALEQRVTTLTGRTPDNVRLIVANGSADSQILSAAEEWGATLLVVGSRGLSGFDRVLLGSVAERVVRYAHTTVLVARPHAVTGRVLAATDFSDPSIPAVEAAAEVARALGKKLTLMHSIDVGPSPIFGFTVPFGGTAITVPPEVLKEAREGITTMLKGLLEQYRIDGGWKVVEGRPGPAIVKEAEAVGAELVVVGTRGRTGLPRMAFGSVAELVVRSAHSSVLIVRLEAR